jgi:phage baseplate assembly protein W
MQDSWEKYGGFLGKGWSFPPSFDRDEQTVVMVTAEEDIRQSLYVLLATIPGERVMLPEYGCFLHDHVFDLIGETLITHLKGLIEHAILFFEPRIVVENIAITAADSGIGRLDIQLDYRIIQTNTRNNMVFPYYFNEGTLVSVYRNEGVQLPVLKAS